MKNAPNSKVNLDRAIQRFAGDVARERELRNLMANAIVAQMIGDGVVKGGTGLKFRYGERMSRVTLDLDTAWKTDLDAFLKGLKSILKGEMWEQTYAYQKRDLDVLPTVDEAIAWANDLIAKLDMA